MRVPSALLIPMPPRPVCLKARPPSATQVDVRVLAVITGGWALEMFATPERSAILNRQLEHYMQACELVRGL